MKPDNTKNRIQDRPEIRFVKIVIKNGLCQFLELKNTIQNSSIYSTITFLTTTCWFSRNNFIKYNPLGSPSTLSRHANLLP